MLKTKSRNDIFAMQNLSNWLSLITCSEGRGQLVDTKNLKKIQVIHLLIRINIKIVN